MTLPPEQWGTGPLIPHSIAESYYYRVTGNSGERVAFYHEDYSEGARKSKKERKGFFLFQRATGEGWADRILNRINRRAIERDNWRRDQGGGQIMRGGMGQATDWAPGPPGGFEEVPQVFGPPGGYWDGGGMWHDAGR